MCRTKLETLATSATRERERASEEGKKKKKSGGEKKRRSTYDMDFIFITFQPPCTENFYCSKITQRKKGFSLQREGNKKIKIKRMASLSVIPRKECQL